MLIDAIKSLIENIKEKIRNPFTEKNSTPFAGAFIVSLILYNWQLFYSLFNFDEVENRSSKIQILQDYLNSMGWMGRIGFPILIAFLSIIFFYVFNNISLGITTFFNRWVKATILYFTDRSKIISRAEFEQTISKMNYLRTRYEELRKTFAESQSELAELKSSLNEKDGKLAKLDLDQKELTTNLLESKRLFNSINEKYNSSLSEIDFLKSAQNDDHVRKGIEEGKNKIHELKKLVSKEQFAPSATKQWIYKNNCLVYDYVFEKEYSIAVDTYFTSEGWEIQIFGRNIPSSYFLYQKLLTSSGFLPEPLSYYKFSDNRLVYMKFRKSESVENVANVLKKLLYSLEKFSDIK